MQFTTLSKLIDASFRDEFVPDRDLPGRAAEPLLARLDVHAIVRAMRDPGRSLDEQGALLAAVIRCYRRTPTPAWSALLLEMLAPTLVATGGRFPYAPKGVDEEDIQQQIMVEALHAARSMRLPERSGFTISRLRDWTVSRTARMLLRDARAECESLEELAEELHTRFDLDQHFLLELCADSRRGDLAVLYAAKTLQLSARELAILMGVSLREVLNRQRRARRRLRSALAAEKHESRSETAAAA